MTRQFVAICITIGLLVAANNSQAQNKIGYISLQELIAAMPEYKTAANDLQDYQKALITQGNENQAEFFRKDSIFKADSVKWTPSMRDLKRKELNEMYLKWANFSQEARDLINKKEQELLAPIQTKAVQTSQAVAKENGYSYILPKEQLISFPAADDILPLVFKKLNISAPAAGAKPAGK